MGHGEEVAEQLNPATADCLPDELLVQILSFLPTKEAVSTSLLSKRWRTLYAFTNNFDDSTFRHQYRSNIQKSFEDFMNRRFAIQGGNNLKKVSVKYTEPYEDNCLVHRWICNALEHDVSELHLSIKPMVYRRLPSKVLTSTTLVKLFLGRGICIDSFPPDIYLPALKVLLLNSVCFPVDKLSHMFLAACPALEDLTIHQTYSLEIAYVISSKTIKKLSFINNGSFGMDCSGMVSLDLPSVVDLYYVDYARNESQQCNLDSLAKAILNLKYYLNKDVADVTNLINGIRNVKSLHLTLSAVQVISACCKGGLPVFNNLVDLVFSSKEGDGKVLLPLLLERSPKLKTLVLSVLGGWTSRRRSFVGFQISPNSQIKMLSIMMYHGSENELKDISHFLLKMECLELVKVYVSSDSNDLKRMQLTEDLLKLPIASPKLEIQII